MAVANISEFSNTVNLTDQLSDMIAPAFLKGVCMVNLMATENLPVRSMTKKFRKDGSLTAATLAESTALAINANGEYTQSSVSATIAKCAVSSGVSVEQLYFGDIDIVDIADKQANAIARFVDDDALSLFTGFATSVTATSILTLDDLYSAQYSIFAAECPNKEVNLQVVLSHKGHANIKKEQLQSSASVWTNQTWLDILQSKPQANCYVGSLPGFDFYATSGHQTSGGDTVQAVFHPMWALAGCFASAPVVWDSRKGSEGLYHEAVSFFFYDVLEYNDLAAVKVLSDT